MKALLWIVLALAALVALMAAIGGTLPVAHQASRSAHFQHDPVRIYELVSDVSGYARWVEDSTPVEIVETVPHERVVTRVADPDLPFGGTWTFEITPVNGGANVTITEDGEVYNPIFRFLSRFVFGHTATMDGFLKDLGETLTGRGETTHGLRDTESSPRMSETRRKSGEFTPCRHGYL